MLWRKSEWPKWRFTTDWCINSKLWAVWCKTKILRFFWNCKAKLEARLNSLICDYDYWCLNEWRKGNRKVLIKHEINLYSCVSTVLGCFDNFLAQKPQTKRNAFKIGTIFIFSNIFSLKYNLLILWLASWYLVNISVTHSTVNDICM